MTPCPRCHGTGKARLRIGKRYVTGECPICHGDGTVPDFVPLPPARVRVVKMGGHVMVTREVK